MSVSVSKQRMVVAEPVEAVRRAVAEARRRGARIGLVPTMGALHAGHVSLIQAARQDCDYVAVSIFVNPTQFGPKEDLSRYPRPLAGDLAACEAEQVDLVFLPQPATIYPPGFDTFVELAGLSSVLEGASRPGHFRGVATVVLKLLNIVLPDVTYFGQKDFQQQTIIRRMCRDLNVAGDIKVCPTVREADGLALSSRNVYLSAEQRQAAPALSRSLNRAREVLQAGGDPAAARAAMQAVLAAQPLIHPDYATIVDPETLAEVETRQPHLVAVVAARLGATRLIDNLPIDLSIETA